MEPVVRFFQPPSKSYFLLGARGAGKSMWIHHFYPSAYFIDLLDPELHWSYQAFPSRLKEFVHAHADATVFVVDEVQRVPTLLRACRQLAPPLRRPAN